MLIDIVFIARIVVQVVACKTSFPKKMQMHQDWAKQRHAFVHMWSKNHILQSTCENKYDFKTYTQRNGADFVLIFIFLIDGKKTYLQNDSRKLP